MDMDVTAYSQELEAQAARVVAGDLKGLEAMLTCQANTLDAMFNRLAARAAQCEFLPQMETYLRHALRAQSLCRATVEALGELKNPRPVAFVQQANIASGPQQVNNGVAPATCTGEKTANQANKLLVDDHGTTTLDTGAARMDGRDYPALAAVGEVHRAGDRKRQG
ncbi:hypothetical protein [Cupriavidus metallidurans]|uniref:hypothetical protein n=1 Tax=Cupriavidus metallidurans TaxID=119219 RepID=UPI00131A3B26|nr:hypothetical protein [Cupriavidus metallidurans]